MDQIVTELRTLSRMTWLFLIVVLLAFMLATAFAVRKIYPPQPKPLPAEPDAIGGVVYCDYDSDGLPLSGSDVGAPGVTVELHSLGDGSQRSDVTRLSGEYRGAYQFTNVAPGEYEIRVVETTLPAALKPPNRTQPPAGADWPTQTMFPTLAIVGPHFGYVVPSLGACP